jgi:prepilin-type processing-associated H-X9-DG protein
MEAGRGALPAQCVNNLRQFGLAIASYEVEHGSLPPTAKAVPFLPLHGMSCFFSDANISAYMGLITASSNHPGGVNCGFLDGSVKFISDSISLPTWRAPATMPGGEIIDSASY